MDTGMDESPNPYQSPRAPSQAVVLPEQNANDWCALLMKKRRYLIAVLVVMFLSGLFEGILPLTERQARRLDIISGVIAAVLIYQWCVADARQRSTSLWKYAALTFVICPGPIIVLPIHFIRSRGVGRGLIGTLYAMGFFALMIATSMIGVFLGSLIGEFAGICTVTTITSKSNSSKTMPRVRLLERLRLSISGARQCPLCGVLFRCC
jgi:hypothetical protein